MQVTDVAEVNPQNILDKWNARLEAQQGHGTFLRHLDGNLMNTDSANLECVHPFDAFAAMYHNLGWTVDWGTGLTEKEQAFVRGNLWNFCAAYEAEDIDEKGGEEGSADPSKAPKVVFLTEQGDKAMEADDFELALQFYEAAKQAREEAMFGERLDTGNDQLSKTQPLHGRRSAKALGIPRSGPVVCVSTPSRRVQPEGALSRKEEVKQRIAARDAGLGR